MKIRIKTDVVEFDGDLYLLPNNFYRFCDEIEVQGRLYQTRTGANYHYRLRVPDFELYGRQPYVHLLFKNAHLYTGEWHGSIPCHCDCEKCNYYCVGLGGTLIDVPLLIFSEEPPVDLTFRKERRELMRKIKATCTKVQEVQGDITIYFVDHKHSEELQKYLRAPNRPIIIQARDHKHYIYRLEGKIFRSANDVLFIKGEEDNISFRITTDDKYHWHEGLRFDFQDWLTQKEAVLISHP